MDTLFLGIDPGKSGGYSVIDAQREVLYLCDWPDDEFKLALDLTDLLHSAKLSRHNVIAALEYAHGIPKHGAVGSFNFGTNWGIWKGILAAKGIPFDIVKAVTWRKGVLLKAEGKDKKEQELAAARRLFPQRARELVKSRYGRPASLLIADWLRKQNVHKTRDLKVETGPSLIRRK